MMSVIDIIIMHSLISFFFLLPDAYSFIHKKSNGCKSQNKQYTMPPNQVSIEQILNHDIDNESNVRVAILGCGMMGQEHISYITGYSDLRIDFICDPNQTSLNQSIEVLQNFSASAATPMLLCEEEDLLEFSHAIDLLVIASPNYLHSDSLLRWVEKDVTILGLCLSTVVYIEVLSKTHMPFSLLSYLSVSRSCARMYNN